MDIKKEVLSRLKRAEECFINENYESASNIVNSCITMLEQKIKEDDELASEYIDDLVKHLK